MNDMNEFEQQVEQEERAQTEPAPETNEDTGPDIEFEVEFEEQDGPGAVDAFIEKIKELVQKGNVTKIVVKKGEDILVNIPLNVGIVGGIIGLATAPWAILAAAIAAAGFSCAVELVKADGEVVTVGFGGVGQKLKDTGAAVADGFREAAGVWKAQDPDIEVEIEQEPAAPDEEIPFEETSDETTE